MRDEMFKKSEEARNAATALSRLPATEKPMDIYQLADHYVKAANGDYAGAISAALTDQKPDVVAVLKRASEKVVALGMLDSEAYKVAEELRRVAAAVDHELRKGTPGTERSRAEQEVQKARDLMRKVNDAEKSGDSKEVQRLAREIRDHIKRAQDAMKKHQGGRANSQVVQLASTNDVGDIADTISDSASTIGAALNRAAAAAHNLRKMELDPRDKSAASEVLQNLVDLQKLMGELRGNLRVLLT